MSDGSSRGEARRTPEFIRNEWGFRAPQARAHGQPVGV